MCPPTGIEAGIDASKHVNEVDPLMSMVHQKYISNISWWITDVAAQLVLVYADNRL